MDISLLYNNIDLNTINIYITKITEISKTNIQNNYFIITQIGQDDKCLFRCIIKFFSGEEKYHLYIKAVIYNYIINNKKTLMANNMYIHDNNKIVYLDDYIGKIKFDSNYSGELEIYCVFKSI